jgi:50S ribosomal protein L16 3-hydroxylase
MPEDATRALLNGLTPATFLRRHWQKRPLLARRAIPGFRGVLRPSELFALAGRDDVESRIVLRERTRWSVWEGPFRKSVFKRLPPRGWTLLVHGVNLHVVQAEALLRRFAFIPYARLDDLMVSYAVPGGGVGPHFDSYDVFLLQGPGRRRWRVGRQRDLALKPGVPLKILACFDPTSQYTLSSGDILYLPPKCAHDGMALDECSTYSIGFRAPSAQELGTAFLDWIRDRLSLERRYADPGLTATREPARIGGQMHAQCAAMIGSIRWKPELVERFVGCYLTEPKPHVFFHRPRHPLPLRQFALVARRRGIRLDPRSQVLYDERLVYVNGAALDWPATRVQALKRLANSRRLAGADVSGVSWVRLLYRWYCDGYLDFD